MTKAFAPEDLDQHCTVSQLHAHPHEPLLACVVESSDTEEDNTRKRIWCVPLEGGKPWPMTQEGPSARNPQWSPDGKQLAFISDRAVPGGSGHVERLFVMPRQGGEAALVARLPGVVVSARWAPDSRRMAVLVAGRVDPE